MAARPAEGPTASRHVLYWGPSGASVWRSHVVFPLSAEKRSPADGNQTQADLEQHSAICFSSELRRTALLYGGFFGKLLFAIQIAYPPGAER